MTSALIELGSSNRRIIDIAIDYQFESQESFTRAFKLMFGLTPGDCRKRGIQSIRSLAKPRITMEYLDHLYGGMTMKPKLVKIQAMKVVGFGGNFISILSPEKSNFSVIPKLWDQLNQHSGKIKNRSRVRVGLCECIKEDLETKTHPDECYYLAGFEVTGFDSIPEGMDVKTVPAGHYAVFTHRGKLDKLEMTMSFIYGSWLPKSGEALREAPDLEIYDERFKLNSDDSEVDLYIPIQ